MCKRINLCSVLRLIFTRCIHNNYYISVITLVDHVFQSAVCRHSIDEVSTISNKLPTHDHTSMTQTPQASNNSHQ